MERTPAECRAELTSLGWTVYVNACGTEWTVSARQEGAVCFAKGVDRIAVWNAVLAQAHNQEKRSA